MTDEQTSPAVQSHLHAVLIRLNLSAHDYQIVAPQIINSVNEAFHKRLQDGLSPQEAEDVVLCAIGDPSEMEAAIRWTRISSFRMLTLASLPFALCGGLSLFFLASPISPFVSLPLSFVIGILLGWLFLRHCQSYYVQYDEGLVLCRKNGPAIRIALGDIIALQLTRPVKYAKLLSSLEIKHTGGSAQRLMACRGMFPVVLAIQALRPDLIEPNLAQALSRALSPNIVPRWSARSVQIICMAMGLGCLAPVAPAVWRLELLPLQAYLTGMPLLFISFASGWFGLYTLRKRVIGTVLFATCAWWILFPLACFLMGWPVIGRALIVFYLALVGSSVLLSFYPSQFRGLSWCLGTFLVAGIIVGGLAPRAKLLPGSMRGVPQEPHAIQGLMKSTITKTPWLGNPRLVREDLVMWERRTDTESILSLLDRDERCTTHPLGNGWTLQPTTPQGEVLLTWAEPQTTLVMNNLSTKQHWAAIKGSQVVSQDPPQNCSEWAALAGFGEMGDPWSPDGKLMAVNELVGKSDGRKAEFRVLERTTGRIVFARELFAVTAVKWLNDTHLSIRVDEGPFHTKAPRVFSVDLQKNLCEQTHAFDFTACAATTDLPGLWVLTDTELIELETARHFCLPQHFPHHQLDTANTNVSWLWNRRSQRLFYSTLAETDAPDAQRRCNQGLEVFEPGREVIARQTFDQPQLIKDLSASPDGRLLFYTRWPCDRLTTDRPRWVPSNCAIMRMELWDVETGDVRVATMMGGLAMQYQGASPLPSTFAGWSPSGRSLVYWLFRPSARQSIPLDVVLWETRLPDGWPKSL